MKIGDRVKGQGYYDGLKIEGKRGTIVALSYSGRFGIKFDDLVNGHTLRGDLTEGSSCQDGYGWWVPESLLTLIESHVCNPLCSECMKNPREAVEF